MTRILRSAAKRLNSPTRAWILGATVVIAVTGCGTSDTTSNTSVSAADNGSVGRGAATQVVPLSEQFAQDCRTVFDEDPIDSRNVIVVADPTQSAAPMTLPDALSTELSEVSAIGGSVSLIMVGGMESQPEVVLLRGALSTPQEDRTAPSLSQIAEMAPLCVADIMAENPSPRSPGTDLYRAMAAAAEIVDADSTVYVLTDLESNTGQLDLKQWLFEPYGTAAAAAAAAAPVDLQGVPLRVFGIGNGHSLPDPAARSWMVGFATDLCIAWKATDCDSITAEPRIGANDEDQPAQVDDERLTFPSIISSAVPAAVTTSSHEAGETVLQTCRWSIPAALTFAGDSATLRDDAADTLTDQIALMTGNESTSLTIVGHTASSSRYTAQELVDLSQRRAESTATLFRTAGVPAARITVRGLGDTEPLAEDIDPGTGQQIVEQAALERRVDLFITGEGVEC